MNPTPEDLARELESREWRGKVSATLTQVLDGQKELKNQFDKYVTKLEFLPVKLVAFGLVGAIVIGVLSALLTTIIK